jgi:hypothetical protein
VKTTAASRSGIVVIELIVAIGILVTTMLPLAFAFMQEQRLARAYYFRAVAIEIIDGEMEVLMAGQWRALSQGSQPFAVRAASARTLPPGQFIASLQERQLRLEWRPAKPGRGGPVWREASVPAALPGGGDQQ